MKQAAILMIGAVLAGQGHAAFLTGNTLLGRLKSDNNFDKGVGTGYIAGVADELQGTKVCLSRGVNSEQLRDIVVRFLEQQPESRHLAGHTLIGSALETAFPCPAK